MARIGPRNIELIVRSALHARGYRFRPHSPELPGRPDVVLPRHGTIVQVHGCFWHRHPGCRYAYTPKSNLEFWLAKFRPNVERDACALLELQELGWTVHTVWERETKQRPVPDRRLSKLLVARAA